MVMVLPSAETSVSRALMRGHAGLVDQARLERRRGPLRRVELLDVVHEVEADGLLRPGIERGEDARLAVGAEDGRLLEAGLARQLGHVLGAGGVVAVLRGDG